MTVINSKQDYFIIFIVWTKLTLVSIRDNYTLISIAQSNYAIKIKGEGENTRPKIQKQTMHTFPFFLHTFFPVFLSFLKLARHQPS